MEADEILSKAKTEQAVPEGWVVFPLLRPKMVWGIIGWFFGILIGLGLFALMAAITIPVNYEHGMASSIFTTLLLGMFLFIGLGSIYLIIVDIARLRDANNHVIVITGEDFVKQEGKRIIHTPLANIRDITVRGTPPPDRSLSVARETSVQNLPSAGESITGLLFGRNVTRTGSSWSRKRRRVPASLAFVDTHTGEEVAVVADEAYGDHYKIAWVLKEYTAAVQKEAQ